MGNGKWAWHGARPKLSWPTKSTEITNSQRKLHPCRNKTTSYRQRRGQGADMANELLYQPQQMSKQFPAGNFEIVTQFFSLAKNKRLLLAFFLTVTEPEVHKDCKQTIHKCFN